MLISSTPDLSMLFCVILIMVNYVFIRTPLTQLDLCLWAYNFTARLDFMNQHLTSLYRLLNSREKSPI